MLKVISRFFDTLALTKTERNVIFVVTLGSILEWHEIFLFVYWEPIVAHPTYTLALPSVALINTVLIILTAWVARPFGGVLFGYIGDRWGRKTAFILSILLVSLPSLLMWVASSFLAWGVFTIVFFGLMRFFQGIPAGSEAPGAICYFAESSAETRRTYICSYVFFGSQLGQLISMIECLLMKKYLPPADLLTWGWKLSFLVGGALGLFGFVLRRKMRESHSFASIKEKNKTVANPIQFAFQHHWQRMLLCVGLSLYEVTGFFLVAVFPMEQFSKIFNLSANQNILIVVCSLVLGTILLPIFGTIKKNRPRILRNSVIAAALTALLLYASIHQQSLAWTITFQALLIFFLSIAFAFFPALIAELFPTTVRYTCLGFSFNICDSLIVGASPILIHSLIKTTGQPASFILILPLTALIFLACLHLKNRKGYLFAPSSL